LILRLPGSKYLRQVLSRSLVALQVLAIALALPVSSALAAPKSGASIVGLNSATVAPKSVRAVPVPLASIANRKALVKPFLTAHPSTFLANKAAAQARVSANSAPAAPLPLTGSVTTYGGFPTVTLSSQVARYGADQNLEPPEPYVAAGTIYVTQTNNDVMSFWTKTGTVVGGVDLNAFVGVPSGYTASDPRVEYDTASGRWFISMLAFNASYSSLTYVGVSQTSDPTGLWWIYALPTTTNIIQDQPKLGINDDKVVIAYDEYTTTAWLGTQILIFQKSDLLSGLTANYNYTNLDQSMFSVVPSQSLSSTTTEYLAFNNADPTNLVQSQPTPTIGVIAVTGTPLQGNVTLTETDVAMPATQLPPSGRQPGGTVNTDDDRFTNAVWQNGTLWTGGNNGCTPTGDTTLRSCLRLVQVSTTGISPTVVQAVDYGFKGYDLYYPAEGLDSSNNVVVTFSGSSSTLYPSIGAFGARAGVTISSAITPVLLGKGLDTYTNTRWGDYFGAATDPSDPTKIWISGEYSAAPSGNWGTGLAKVSVP